MHGLLSIYFDPARDNLDQRVHDLVRAVLGRARVPSRRGWLVRLVSPRLWVGPGRVRTIFGRTITRRQALGGSLAAAAVILLAVLVTVSPAFRSRVAAVRLPAVPSLDARCEAALVQPMPRGAGLNDPGILCGWGADGRPTERGPRSSASHPAGAEPGRYGWGTGSQPVRWSTGYQPVSLLADWVRDLDCGSVDERLAMIEAARRQRDAYLAEIDALVQRGEDPFKASASQAVMQAWTQVYRPLRALGHWDEALAEIHAAIAYAAGENPSGQRVGNWDMVCLSDLAETLEAVGDYDAARTAHLESVRVRKEMIRASGDYVGDPDELDLPMVLGGAYGTDLISSYTSMSWLPVLRDGPAGLPEACAWQAKAETQLIRYFFWICQASGVGVPPANGVPPFPAVPPINVDTLLTLYRALPPDFQRPPEQGYGPDPAVHGTVRASYHGFLPDAGPINWLRVVLYNAARLRRVAGDYAAAAAILADLATIPPYAFTDEWRLNFFEPLESARVAALRHDDAAALAYLDAAAAVSGAAECPWEPDFNKIPVGLLPRMEHDLLRGAALVRLNRSADEVQQGHRLLAQVAQAVERLTERMEPAQAAAFRRAFEVWNELAMAAR